MHNKYLEILSNPDKHGKERIENVHRDFGKQITDYKKIGYTRKSSFYYEKPTT